MTVVDQEELYQGLVALMQLPLNAPWIALDTETSGLHPDDGARVACLSVTWPVLNEEAEASKVMDWQTVAFPFNQGRAADKIRNYQPTLEESMQVDLNYNEGTWVLLLEWLKTQKIVFHNAKFDLTMMAAGTDHWPGVDLSSAFYWDTLLAARELEPNQPAGLGEVTLRHGLSTGKEGLDEIKAWLKQHKLKETRYDLAPWDLVRKYVKTDTELTAKLFQWQAEKIARMDDGPREWMRGRLDREFDLCRTLYLMEQRGLGYDVASSLAAAEILEERMEQIAEPFPFKTTPKGLESYYIDQLGYKAERETEKTKKPQIDEEQMRAWAKTGAPFASDYIEWAKVRRFVSMYYRGYPAAIGVDGRLRGSFNQGKVKSGRMSIERVQLQAMPKADKYSAIGSRETLPIYVDIPQVKQLIKPKDGHKIWSLDLSQAELRVAAVYSQCTFMLEQLRDGDIHGITCQEILDGDPDAPDWKFKRDIAKRATFGGIFKVGGPTLQATLAKQADIHITEAEAWKIVNRWRAMYPEIMETHGQAERYVKRHGYVKLLPKTEYEVKSYFSAYDFAVSGTRSAWNRIVQGSLAEAFKLLLIGIEKQWPGRMILTVHDSVVLEMPEDEGDEVAEAAAMWGGEMMSDLFKTPMSMDIDVW